MCDECEARYDEADRFVWRLHALLWWHRARYDVARLERIIARAKARQERRGEAARDCWDAEVESLAWAEAEADYDFRQRYGPHADTAPAREGE